MPGERSLKRQETDTAEQNRHLCQRNKAYIRKRIFIGASTLTCGIHAKIGFRLQIFHSDKDS